MATFNYIKAVWRNGPGVVSDAPDWVRAAIERSLPGWMSEHERELVSIHTDHESGLSAQVFVSPSASSSSRLLDDSPEGSFVHVVASDRPDASESLDAAKLLFESVYGASLSDGALRQQRAFMLLEFPYHEALATDLFAAKDRLEDAATAPGPEDGADGLPFDQGLSYQQVVTRLAESALHQARQAPDSIPKLVPASLRERQPAAEPAAADDAAPSNEAAEADEGPLSLGSLLRRGPAGPATPRAPTPDGLPFDEGLSYQEVLSKLGNAVQATPVAPQPPAIPAQEILEPARLETTAAPAMGGERAPEIVRPTVSPRRAVAGESWVPALAGFGFLMLFLLALVVAVATLQVPLAPEQTALDVKNEPQSQVEALATAPAAVAREADSMNAALPSTPLSTVSPDLSPVSPDLSPVSPDLSPVSPPARAPLAERATEPSRAAEARVPAEPAAGEPKQQVTAIVPVAPAPLASPPGDAHGAETAAASPPERPATPTAGRAAQPSAPPVPQARAVRPAVVARQGPAARPPRQAATATTRVEPEVETRTEPGIQVGDPAPKPALPAVSAAVPAPGEALNPPETSVSQSAAEDVERVKPGVERRRRERKRLLREIRGYR